MQTIYTIGIWFYGLGIRVAALFNEKARQWVRGRKNIFTELERAFSGKTNPVWIHCASLGEYEQAKPLIEKIKQEQPETKILTTFFSPSGYTQGIKNKLSDDVFYMPLDLPRNARRFLDIVQPKAAVFVKYEYWYNFMHQLHQRAIPYYYISAIFRESQHFFKPFGRWFAKQLQQATHFFVQTEKSKQLLETIDVKKVTVCGDTRFDRVKAIAYRVEPFDFMETFRQDRKVIVAGSTWGPDEQLLAQLLQHFPDYKLVVAPHEINRTPEVKQTFAAYKTALYSSKEENNLVDCQVFIIDTIGILNRLYQYSTVSYIGGAFKTGLHNILEAAVYGKPIFFGPHYDHFNEAVNLVALKGAFSVTSADEMETIMTKFEQNPEYYDQTCDICQQYVAQNLGAVDIIYKRIGESLCRDVS
ncbi:MAG: 3-deoxy-D-manno-octulosonic acid transferase [Paludibacteraceae bacterium]|nr:3-deoxy-D-manno-octulosonic acid transferase [Paludibacteraceae bacterium]